MDGVKKYTMDDLYLSNLSGDELEIIKRNATISINSAIHLMIRALPDALDNVAIEQTANHIEPYPIPHEVEGFAHITFQFVGGKELCLPLYPGVLSSEFNGAMVYALVAVAGDYFKKHIAT